MRNADFLASPQGYLVQKTVKRSFTFEGIGLHTGKKSVVKLNPAPPNHGIVFEKVDLKNPVRIEATHKAVVCTALATSLGIADRPETRISTVEHLLAALYAMGVSNVHVEVSGPEIPILDGSALPFIDSIFATGLAIQPFSTPVLKVIKPIKIYQDGAICELLPRDRLRLTTSIDFPHPSIGPQSFAVELTPKVFRDEVCAARTFGFEKDVEKLKQINLAQGASLENVLAFSEEGVLNPEGVRYADECVRHKLLDALGDLALCGSWIEGELVSFRGGHSIHYALLKSLDKFKSHWVMQSAEPLPGLNRIPETVSQPQSISPKYLF